MTCTLEYKSTIEQQSIPPLTEKTIQRAKEGVEYARDRSSNEMIQQALSDDGSEKKISGKIRRMVLRTLIHGLFSIKIEFPERIPTGPVLFAANHLNHIDPFLLLSELPAQPYFHILGDGRTLYNNKWKRLLLRFAKGVIPLERIWKEEIAVIEAFKAGREDLAELAASIEEYVPKGNSIESMRRLDRTVQAAFTRGESILLFPEGKLGSVEGQVLPLKRGAAIYAIRSGVPIVPIALVGTKDLFFRKELTVRIGEPITFSQSNRPKSQQVQAVINELQAAMQDLLPQDYSEPTGKKLFRNFLNHLFW
jgi:1-acyl-sn-glycerol-3-phosphate acyltransferase